MVSRGLNKSRPIGYRRLNKEYRAGSSANAEHLLLRAPFPSQARFRA